MQKFLYLILVFLITTAHANIPIHVMPMAGFSKASNQPTQTNIQTITKQALTHEHVNIGNRSRYALIQVQLVQTVSERYLLVHLISRYYFSYRIIRINLNLNNSIKYPIIKNYHLQPADFLAQSNNDGVAPQCPAQYQTGKPLFVIGTPYYKNFENITHSVDALSQAVLNTHQYQLVKLLGNDATIQNYQNVLACPTLKYFFHMGHSTSDGNSQAFVLSNGDFDATYFSQNPPLNLRDKTITLDSCELFDQVKQGFCPIVGTMPNAPQTYSSGSSDLLIYGSVETYTCFWKAILQGAPVSQTTLAQCAISHDPSVGNSRSGIYFVNQGTPVFIQTNQRVITIQPNDYALLKLNNGEMVTQYAIKINQQTVACTPNPMNRTTLLNNPNLTAGEFTLSEVDGTTCQFYDVSRMIRNGGLSRDIYGFYPTQSCYNVPNPFYGLTISSAGGGVDLNCNGITAAPHNIIRTYLDWRSVVKRFHNNRLECRFNAHATNTEIASMHFNIKSQGKSFGLVSDVKNRNGYPLPTFRYSGKSSASGYHRGVAIALPKKP